MESTPTEPIFLVFKGRISILVFKVCKVLTVICLHSFQTSYWRLVGKIHLGLAFGAGKPVYSCYICSHKTSGCSGCRGTTAQGGIHMYVFRLDLLYKYI